MPNNRGGSFKTLNNIACAEVDQRVDKIEITEPTLFGLTNDELNSRLLEAIYFPKQYGGNLPEDVGEQISFE